MEPGKVYEITIPMYPISNLFRAGHNLRLDISSSNYPHFGPNRLPSYLVPDEPLPYVFFVSLLCRCEPEHRSGAR